MRQLGHSVLIIFFSLVFFSCKSSTDEPVKQTPVPTVHKDTAIAPAGTVDTSFHFTGYALNGSSDLQRLSDSLGTEKMLLVLKVNRLDLKHCKSGDTLIVPSNFADTAMLSPFPLHLDSARIIPKLIFVSQKIQAFAVYDSGVLRRWGPTSTGKKKTPTPEGLYFTNWKKEVSTSTVDPTWILPWCVNIENFEGISFHQFDLPGYPASHSCIRLLEEDAIWIYQWADEWKLTPDLKQVAVYGNPVIIFGEHPFGKKPIWKKVINDPKITKISAQELEDILAQYRTTIEERKRIIPDTTVISLQ
jgi:lipoprotein-anchoring transpeptidase ErfK/SrfK